MQSDVLGCCLRIESIRVFPRNGKVTGKTAPTATSTSAEVWCGGYDNDEDCYDRRASTVDEVVMKYASGSGSMKLVEACGGHLREIREASEVREFQRLLAKYIVRVASPAAFAEEQQNSVQHKRDKHLDRIANSVYRDFFSAHYDYLKRINSIRYNNSALHIVA